MLKKIVSLVVGATLVLATLGVSAATVSTVSEYDATQENITVTTTVSNASAEDVYTYLAYKKGAALATLGNNDVVYVEEKTSVEGEDVVFSYTTLAANNEAVILVGGDASTEEGPAKDEINTTEPAVLKDVIVQINDGQEAPAQVDVTGAVDADYVLVPVAGISDVVISGVTLNEEAFEDYYAAADGLYVPYSAIKAEGSFKFVIATMTGAEEYAVDIWNGAYIPAKGENPDAIIAVANIWGAADEFGIIFGADENFTESFRAVAKGVGTNGMFAIRLNDIKHANSELKNATTTIYAKAFAGDDKETDVLAIDITVPVEEPEEV